MKPKMNLSLIFIAPCVVDNDVVVYIDDII